MRIRWIGGQEVTLTPVQQQALLDHIMHSISGLMHQFETARSGELTLIYGHELNLLAAAAPIEPVLELVKRVNEPKVSP